MAEVGWKYMTSLVIVCVLGQPSLAEENIGLGKTATQSSGSKTAVKAVDGCVDQDFTSGCCTRTDNKQFTAWWRVDLGQISTVDHITIINRDPDGNRKAFAGYYLYLSNSTDNVTGGTLCYQDNVTTAEDVPTNVTHQCPYVARYVTIYNFRDYSNPRKSWYYFYTFLELCEVQVFGCQVGRHGNGNCNETCSEDCYGGNCNPSTGSCLYCAPGTSGIDCINTCGSCADGQCDKNTGNCAGDCSDGFHGAKCDASCPDTCREHRCNKETGTCGGCVLGKHGDYCENSESPRYEANTVVIAVAVSFCVVCLATAVVAIACLIRIKRKWTAEKMKDFSYKPCDEYVVPGAQARRQDDVDVTNM